MRFIGSPSRASFAESSKRAAHHHLSPPALRRYGNDPMHEKRERTEEGIALDCGKSVSISGSAGRAALARAWR